MLDVPNLTSELNILRPKWSLTPAAYNLTMGSMLRLTSSCGACGDLRRSIKRRALIIALDKAFTSASLRT
ncbi:MAG: hypothetical protein ACTS4W_00780 [Candidatus Hodgkinia cicadicola]